MKKFAVIEWRKGADCFETIFDTEKEALSHAESRWNNYLTDGEKKKLDMFAVMFGEIDEDGCFDINTAEMIKSYKR